VANASADGMSTLPLSCALDCGGRADDTPDDAYCGALAHDERAGLDASCAEVA